MSFEQKINEKLRNYPCLRKKIKRLYQYFMYKISEKKTFEGDIKRLSPNDKDHDYFFGYYDKSPWCASGKYVLLLKANNTWKTVAPKESAEILLIDTETNEIKVLAETNAWNVQQGCMLQWLGPDFNEKIIFNDFRDGKFCSIILNIFTGEEHELRAPVYTVSTDGTFALTLDFTRLHRLRPGYGYSNLDDNTINENIPESPCVWKINIKDNIVEPIFYYKDFYNFDYKSEMEGAEHKVNHLMLSPDNKRFMVLHRWIKDNKKYTRLITANIDGTEIYNLSDDGMVSHCCWKDNKTIIAYEYKKGEGNGYYLMRDKSMSYTHEWKFLSADGHPSYSPDGLNVVTDTYPNAKRMSTIRVLTDVASYVVAKVFAPFKYDNDTRCDLHPRWSRDSSKICFDSCFEGHRGVYEIDLKSIHFAYKKDLSTRIEKTVSNKKRIIYVMTSCRKTGPTQQTLNIIKNLDQTLFEPILITLYEEGTSSKLSEYLPYIAEHYFVNLSKRNILLNKYQGLEKLLLELKPDIIHTVGVFPDYVISRIKTFKHVFTLRNYVYDDYLALFGKIKGMILARMQLYAVKHTEKVVACSQSLSEIYKQKLKLNFDFIRNGIDTHQFFPATVEEKKRIREFLNLPQEAFIFVCSGQLIKRKNLPFLLESFEKCFANNNNVYLMIIGDGVMRPDLEFRYGKNKNIKFFGSVSDVAFHLKACDCCVSTSTSEGLPNSVLESMACGLPVILSDIEQHKELFLPDPNIGFLYKKNDMNDICNCFQKVINVVNDEMNLAAYNSAKNNFNAELMSKNYQNNVYSQILRN